MSVLQLRRHNHHRRFTARGRVRRRPISHFLGGLLNSVVFLIEHDTGLLQSEIDVV
ncbi:hypothetical protein KY5_6243c [Streptomyces formicae]|uniref:Uncharacterized protein n=1 Tax=Streptomyces formicae TaxID=1616117 RepID=A0A291QHS8_9ACTN|nr:hypothetical protein KY5_6243c [Streptomyces formicae]